MKRLMTRLLLTLALMGLLLSIACSTDSPSDDTGADGDTDAQNEDGAERGVIFKGGSTVGNPAAVDVIFSTKDDRGSVMWKEITIDITGVYFADGSWPNSDMGALLDPDEPNVLYPIMSDDKITLQLKVPPLHSFGAIDFRLKGSAAFHAEGVTEDGTEVILDSTLYGVLPFSAAGGSFFWESDDKDKLIASIESGRIMRKEMLERMEADDKGRLVVNEYKNASLLEEIDRNIISAFSLYRDKNDNGVLDADELGTENLLAIGNPDRAADWDADWPAMECGDGWESSPRFGEPIYDISGFGDDYAVAVGPSAVYLWDGFDWSYLPKLEDESNTYAVWARGVDDVFVAGEYGIYNWDGQAWTKVFDRGEQVLPLVRIYAISSDNAYAVSNQDMVQFDGNSWNRITPDQWPENPDIYGKITGNKKSLDGLDHPRGMSLAANSKDDLWVYGEEMATGRSLFHYDGIAWTNETQLIEELRGAANEVDPMLENYFAITSIWSTGNNDLWFSSVNMIANFNGERFRIYNLAEENLMVIPDRVHVNSEDDFWFTGTFCDYDSEHWGCTPESERKAVLNFDGNGFIDTGIETDAELTSLWGSSSNNMWIAGGRCINGSGSHSCRGEILHYDGQEYFGGTQDDVFIVGSALKIWGDRSDNAYMITFEGQLLGYNGAEWTELEKSGDIEVNWVYDVSTLAANDVYLTTSLENGDIAVVHWDGQSFTEVFRSEPVPGEYDSFSMYKIFAAAPNDIWVAGVLDLGDGEPAIGHWDGNELEVQIFSRADGANPFNFLKGAGSDNIWAMSTNEYHGYLIHWDGESWKRQTIKVDQWHHLTDIAVLSEDKIIGAGMGKMFLYNGVKWEEMDTGLEDVWIESLQVVGPSEVYGVGREGAVVKYDGESWSMIPVCTDVSLSTVWGSGGNELWVGGENGTLLHYSAE